MQGQDAELLKEYFLIEQERDPSFMFEIDADDECKLKHCFWSDSVCRRAYGCFGDVVVFDTTYNTNQYGMIFAPLVWVNNHGQTVIFACAFLSDERIESFVWLFEVLKKSMPCKCLKDDYHRSRSCNDKGWIFTRISNTAFGNQNVRKSLKENGLLSSKMRTYMTMNGALAHQRHEDLYASHVDINEKPVLKLPLEMEKQMVEIYIRKIFYKFQDELWHSLVTVPQIVSENDTHKMYTVQSCPNESVPRFREIAYDKVLDYASCSCKKFESEGIPCRHILAFLRLFGDIPLPNQYIMKRWSRVAKSQIIYDKEGVAQRVEAFMKKVNDTTLKDPSQGRIGSLRDDPCVWITRPVKLTWQ
ncbi:protein FAR1-RELATED SEQUENCE 3-like [Ziziphus jujuba]|uniref:Protein FAR1-RELATED SEQUENCE n=1 Tax=Ziziphus jujuba TaxID=326968 RepID=A0ABM4AAY1_ZIZJJ|nr:protein FAR1-RELATED SEQUENCE 3-like [Ziziphus jujuba]